jgi:hypothetical protein
MPLEEFESAVMQRLDSRLEREMYADVGLRNLIRYRVAYHHAGLPPRVREALEEAISAEHIKYVIATTTLAEGVNFPFSVVIVQSLSVPDPSFETGKPMSYRLFTPRKFWNIAGRAGRPGFDHEGQVILFEPTLGLDRVNQVVDPYVEPDIRLIPPVRSALADGFQAIRQSVESGELDLNDLASINLPKSVSPRVHGMVNLLRVGLAHAAATEADIRGASYFDSTLAAQMLSADEASFARGVVRQQEDVMRNYLASPGAASVELVAQLGLSIETLSQLQAYVGDLPDWQLERVTHVVRGGRINFEQLPYLISSVLSRMKELEGERVSGWYSQVVVDWCRGQPFSAIRSNRERKLEDLVRLMYSRIQYILPWALYATDRFVGEEAERRGISYAGEVNQLAYLVDAGVPSWPALRLTTAGFERSDAARLAAAYQADFRSRERIDVLAWVGGQPEFRLIEVLRGPDRRRIDFDFPALVGGLRPAST